MNSPFRNRVEVLNNVPQDKLQQVVGDFQDAGAKVAYSQQPDKNYRVEAIFVEILDTPNSNIVIPSSGSYRNK